MTETIKCKICGQEFEFSDEEKQFYVDRNLFYPPKRCPNCRAKKRRQIQKPEEVKAE